MKKIIICDIDGTLAFKCDREVFDFSLAENDKINKPIAKLLELYNGENYGTVFVTGRPEHYREVTENWLNNYHIDYVSLFMRPNNDNRSQKIVKKEIFIKYIKPIYEIELVIDDNDSLIEMWKTEFGLNCLQV